MVVEARRLLMLLVDRYPCWRCRWAPSLGCTSFSCARAQGQPVLAFGQLGKVFQPTYRSRNLPCWLYTALRAEAAGRLVCYTLSVASAVVLQL